MIPTLLATALFAARVLTLSQALDTAEKNPALRSARGSTEIADGVAEGSRAALLPTITVDGTFTRQSRNRLNLIQQPPANYRMFNTISYRLSGSQVLFDLPRFEGMRADQAAARAARGDEEFERASVRASVRAAFFKARQKLELVKVQADALVNQETHRKQVEGFVAAGRNPQSDLAKARADEAKARLAAIQAENDYFLSKSALNQALGVGGSTDYDVADETFPAVDGEDDGADALLARALSSRPDLRSRADIVESRKLGVRRATAAYLPTVNLTGRADDTGPTNSHLVPNIRYDLAVSVPIFSGLLTHAQIHQAKGELVRAEADRDALVAQAAVDVENARIAVRGAKAEQNAAEEAFNSAAEQLRLAEERYKVGAGSILELADAQLSHTQTAQQRVDANYLLGVARAQLLLALGKP